MNLLIAALSLPMSLSPVAHDPGAGDSLTEALKAGRTYANLRYRIEHVDADGFAEDADAGTMRAVLGYESGAWKGLSGLVEFETVTPIGLEDYNSTVNGETDFPVVVDPEGVEVNQLYVDYALGEGFDLRLGRQELALDNQRFLGPVAWRQNHQSFDALTLRAPDLGGLDGTYAYIDQVHRIFGDENAVGDEHMSTHMLNVSRGFEGIGKATAYAYLLDFDDNVAQSTSTYGARFSGKRELDTLGLRYTLEYAAQEDAGDNPNEVDADYLLAEVGADFEGVAVTAGAEYLSGSGDPGDRFQTPLATLHAFNGFADLFLNTPDTGLEDHYLRVSGKLGAVKAALTYHVFDSDSGGIDYGDELDLTLGYKVDEQISVGFKFARFEADEAFADVTKGMVWVSVGLL
ncbi:MAG: alginate export family protein [Planctomycetota bacterium]|nr:alginate export family protein [Planctomycetota bacterium]